MLLRSSQRDIAIVHAFAPLATAVTSKFDVTFKDCDDCPEMVALGIRAAKLSDAAAIGSLGIQLVHWADPGRARERMEAVLGRDDQAIFVAEDSEGLVGWIHVLTALRLTVDRFGEVVGLVVAEWSF